MVLERGQERFTKRNTKISNDMIHLNLPSPPMLAGESQTDRVYYQNRTYGSRSAPNLLYDSAEEASGQHYHSVMLRRCWFETVEDYFKKKLTKSKDKLTALLGLTHSYYEREDQLKAPPKGYKGGQRGGYAAGLWEAHMPSALLWPTWSAQRPSEYRAPSWSWASVDGRISYNRQTLDSEHDYGGIGFPDDRPSPREPSEYDIGDFRVQEIETTTSSLDPMGAVSAGHITLKGVVAVTTSDEETYAISESDSPYSEEETYSISQSDLLSTYTWLRDSDCMVVGALFADVQTEVRPNNIYCVSVRNERDFAVVRIPGELVEEYGGTPGDYAETFEVVMGLGLTRIGAEEDGKGLRRLGLVRWVRKSLFAGKEVSTIKIV